jgi:hypothetical protein
MSPTSCGAPASSRDSWIDLPVFDDDGHVAHERGVVEVVPGLYFVGLKFQYSVLSDTLLAAGRDSGYVVDHLVEERRTSPSTERASLETIACGPTRSRDAPREAVLIPREG